MKPAAAFTAKGQKGAVPLAQCSGISLVSTGSPFFVRGAAPVPADAQKLADSPRVIRSLIFFSPSNLPPAPFRRSVALRALNFSFICYITFTLVMFLY
jgi:hypothetical protein